MHDNVSTRARLDLSCVGCGMARGCLRVVTVNE